MRVEKTDPSPDVGRCSVCQSEPATWVLSIDRTCEVRFCEMCFDKFRSMLVGTANPANLLETLKELGWWAEQVVSSAKDAGAKECGEFVKMCCKEALASKRRNCDEFTGDVVDAAAKMYGRFLSFCCVRECPDCKIWELGHDMPKHVPCFSIWSLMERNGNETK